MDDESMKAVSGALAAVAGEAYKDIVHPAAARVGSALDVVAKLVLSPVHLLDWGFERSREWLNKKIRERFEDVPEEHVAIPPANIAYPALAHIAMSYDSPELRDLYAELLLKAMDKRTANQIHPSYVFVIEQLSPQEALVLIGLHPKHKEPLFTDEFALSGGKVTPRIENQFVEYCESIGVSHPENGVVWLENLRRLGLLELHVVPQAEYHPESGNEYGIFGPSVETTEFRELLFTEFGHLFVKACEPSTHEP